MIAFIVKGDVPVLGSTSENRLPVEGDRQT